jgi:hypothetical protein
MIVFGLWIAKCELGFFDICSWKMGLDFIGVRFVV